jgi:hypothetical protein
MKITRVLSAAIAAIVFGTPAFADYFIVREGSSGPCRVIESRPTDTKIIVIGNSLSDVGRGRERNREGLRCRTGCRPCS